MLIVADFFTPSTPASGSSVERIARALSDDRAGHQMALLLGLLTAIAFLVFLAGLWSRFRRYEGSGGMMAGLFAIAGTAFAATVLVSEGIYLALVQAAVTDDRSVLPALSALDNWVGFGTIAAAVAMLIGATGAILSTHAFPAWLGYLSGLSGVLLVLLSLGAVYSTDNESLLAGPGWFGGFLLFLVWALVANVLLLRPTHRTHAAA